MIVKLTQDSLDEHKVNLLLAECHKVRGVVVRHTL